MSFIYLTLLAAFRENWGLRADSNQLAVYSAGVSIPIQVPGMDGVIKRGSE